MNYNQFSGDLGKEIGRLLQERIISIHHPMTREQRNAWERYKGVRIKENQTACTVGGPIAMGDVNLMVERLERLKRNPFYFLARVRLKRARDEFYDSLKADPRYEGHRELFSRRRVA